MQTNTRVTPSASLCLMYTFQGLLLKPPVSTAIISAGSPGIGRYEEAISTKAMLLVPRLRWYE